MSTDIPFQVKGITRELLKEEVDAEQESLYDMHSWNNCYFHREKSELLHEKHQCMVCDWKRYIGSVKQSDIDNLDFIEAWEWEDVWNNRKEQIIK